MKKLYLLFLSVFCTSLSVLSQQIVWKTNVHSFFDNTEFERSSIQIPQTMTGIHLAPEAGIRTNDFHYIFTGIDFLHEFGSEQAIDYYNPIIYYQYICKPFQFCMGAFPRNLVTNKYPRMFFQDSIQNYRPIMNGFFWEFNPEKIHANVWLDWTSRQTNQKRETFFMGWSAKIMSKGIFYGRHIGYMFHFANTKQKDKIIHDNGLVLTSLGIDLTEKTALNRMEINLG